jgi:ADP-ribosylglycohydrolase
VLGVIIMLGAIAGDVIGSIYEHHRIKSREFQLFDPECRFTDDTVLTVAVADTLLEGGDYADQFRTYYRLYPNAGYGGTFRRWARPPGSSPYNSFGNGSAMRVSPVGLAFNDLSQVRSQARRSAEVTHNHPEAHLAHAAGADEPEDLIRAELLAYMQGHCCRTILSQRDQRNRQKQQTFITTRRPVYSVLALVPTVVGEWFGYSDTDPPRHSTT